MTPLSAVLVSTFLCLRRGVSNPDILTDAPQRLFSAYAEVFLRGGF